MPCKKISYQNSWLKLNSKFYNFKNNLTIDCVKASNKGVNYANNNWEHNTKCNACWQLFNKGTKRTFKTRAHYSSNLLAEHCHAMTSFLQRKQVIWFYIKAINLWFIMIPIRIVLQGLAKYKTYPKKNWKAYLGKVAWRSNYHLKNKKTKEKLWK